MCLCVYIHTCTYTSTYTYTYPPPCPCGTKWSDRMPTGAAAGSLDWTIRGTPPLLPNLLPAPARSFFEPPPLKNH